MMRVERTLESVGEAPARSKGEGAFSLLLRALRVGRQTELHRLVLDLRRRLGFGLLGFVLLGLRPFLRRGTALVHRRQDVAQHAASSGGTRLAFLLLGRRGLLLHRFDGFLDSQRLSVGFQGAGLVVGRKGHVERLDIVRVRGFRARHDGTGHERSERRDEFPALLLVLLLLLGRLRGSAATAEILRRRHRPQSRFAQRPLAVIGPRRRAERPDGYGAKEEELQRVEQQSFTHD